MVRSLAGVKTFGGHHFSRQKLTMLQFSVTSGYSLLIRDVRREFLFQAPRILQVLRVQIRIISEGEPFKLSTICLKGSVIVRTIAQPSFIP